MNILIPLSSRSKYFPLDDYPFPVPLIEVGGEHMIERVIENLKTVSQNVHFIFVIRKSDAISYSLDKVLKHLCNGECSVVMLENETKGALCSSLMAIKDIEKNDPLIIANGDQIVTGDLSSDVGVFLASEADGGVLTFKGVHPRWSFVKCDSDSNVHHVAEKEVISKDAIAGLYYFKKGELFIDSAKRALLADDHHQGQFFITSCLKQMLIDGMNVKARKISLDRYHSFFSPKKIEDFEKLKIVETNAKYLRPDEEIRNMNIVIPAAGKGSRFESAGYSKRKPFIDVHGQPMVSYVLDNLRTFSSTPIILLQQDDMQQEEEIIDRLKNDGCKIISIDGITEGTASSVLHSRKLIDNDQPLLVANSDQYVDFDCFDFVKDCIDRDLDGSILVFKDLEKNPKWSFARLEDELVIEVAEKKAISDLATVGIYLFRRGSDFVGGAIDMIVSNDRVNGEFYTCPVYNYLISEGLKIGVYEIPKSAMNGLGTPADLEDFLKKSS